MIKDANDMLDEFDKDDTPQKILISYLLERGTGLNFKFSLFHKAIEFSEKLKKWNLENILEEFLLKEYIKYFVCFRDLYLFYEDRFFAEVDNIVSGILEAQQKYIRDAKDSVNPNVLELLSTDKIHQIIKDLYDFMIELISNSTNDTLYFDEFENQFKNKFDKPTNRIKYNKELWKLTQEYVNLHIATDYNNTYFDTVPQFNMYKYESSINFHLQMMFYKDSTL